MTVIADTETKQNLELPFDEKDSTPDKCKVPPTPLFDEYGRTPNVLTVKGCQEILKSYKTNQDLSIFKLPGSGFFYKGKYSTYAIRDLLAGGATNNLFFKYYRRSPYAIITLLIHEIICRNEPHVAEGILRTLSDAKELSEIQKFAEVHRKYLPNKCYYDLQKDFAFSLPKEVTYKLVVVDIGNNTKYLPEFTTNNLHLARQRQAESESRRLSKVMCVGWAACQGCIEMMGVKSLPFFIGLASPWAAVAVLVLTFMFGYFINYVFPREDAEKLILRWKLGNLFKRKVGVSEAEEPIYENYTIIERGVFKIFAVLSLCTALNIFGLGVASILEWTFVPLVVAHIIPLVLIVPACLLFTNTVHNYIDEKGIDKLKNYYHLHIKPNSFKDYVKLPFELIKVIGTIAISVIVFFATFLILQSKALMLFSSVFSINTANTLANMTTGITASVKAIFSLSKISHLFGSAISCIFYRKKSERSVPDMEEDKKTERETKIDKETASTIEIFKTIQRKETGVRIAITVVEAVAVGCHGFAEKGLAVQSLNHESLVRTLNHQQLRSPLEQVVIEDGKAWYAWLTTFKSAVLGNKSQNEYEMKPSSRLVR